MSNAKHAPSQDPFTRTQEENLPVFHLPGCPAERIETWSDTQPHRVDGGGRVVHPARDVKVTRCTDCGAHLVTTLDGERVDAIPRRQEVKERGQQ